MNLIGIIAVLVFLFQTLTCVNIWPHPLYISEGEFPVYINKIKFVHDPLQCKEWDDVLQNSIGRYQKIITEGTVSPSEAFCEQFKCISDVLIQLNDKSIECKPLQLYNDEEYFIYVSDMIRIQANTVWGLIRGLETLSQLVVRVESSQVIPSINNTPLKIHDKPRFPWRGFMLDTSRHYYSIQSIITLLDAMSYLKLNVFHWHIIDDQSFPYFISKKPEMSEKGSYGPKLDYNRDDIRNIVKYANERGIRVVMEVDMPGHAHSWGHGGPECMTKCPGYYSNVLDVSKNITYQTINQILDEIQNINQDSYLHIGGDEVSQECYKNDPDIQEYMSKKQIPDVDHLIAHFTDRISEILSERNLTMLCWHDLTNYQGIVKPPSNTIVEAWWSLKNVGIVIDRGYRVLNSAGWYLDYLNVDVWEMYLVEPFSVREFTTEQKEMILGGEAAMWSEYVNDYNLFSRVFPRLLAVAERLWSPQNINNKELALPRIEYMICEVMVYRGIKVSPVEPGHCRHIKYNKPW